MPDSLVDLESRRSAVQSQIAQLGDMRSGSISETGGCCGNPNCHCHRADDPGHGPYYRLTRKVNGKTVTATVDDPATPLLYVLRNDAGLHGPRFGCGLGQCGSCTVHINGEPVRSCTRGCPKPGAASPARRHGGAAARRRAAGPGVWR